MQQNVWAEFKRKSKDDEVTKQMDYTFGHNNAHGPC